MAISNRILPKQGSIPLQQRISEDGKKIRNKYSEGKNDLQRSIVLSWNPHEQRDTGVFQIYLPKVLPKKFSGEIRVQKKFFHFSISPEISFS